MSAPWQCDACSILNPPHVVFCPQCRLPESRSRRRQNYETYSSIANPTNLNLSDLVRHRRYEKSLLESGARGGGEQQAVVMSSFTMPIQTPPVPRDLPVEPSPKSRYNIIVELQRSLSVEKNVREGLEEQNKELVESLAVAMKERDAARLEVVRGQCKAQEIALEYEIRIEALEQERESYAQLVVELQEELLKKKAGGALLSNKENKISNKDNDDRLPTGLKWEDGERLPDPPTSAHDNEVSREDKEDDRLPTGLKWEDGERLPDPPPSAHGDEVSREDKEDDRLPTGLKWEAGERLPDPRPSAYDNEVLSEDPHKEGEHPHLSDKRTSQYSTSHGAFHQIFGCTAIDFLTAASNTQFLNYLSMKSFPIRNCKTSSAILRTVMSTSSTSPLAQLNKVCGIADRCDRKSFLELTSTMNAYVTDSPTPLPYLSQIFSK